MNDSKSLEVIAHELWLEIINRTVTQEKVAVALRRVAAEKDKEWQAKLADKDADLDAQLERIRELEKALAGAK